MDKSTLEKALKIFSWVCVVLGILTFIGSFIEWDVDSGYGLFGGGILIVEGVIALYYIKENER